ncbi:MAG: hypothetical protein KatS3mg051_0756 [Anaerolineae bacterium]|nr:MAG: hypothetical protein KatS3mg051_0756 [Anaerolineae bacterium]
MVVVGGGGPTGLETAGALRELYRYVLSKEFGPPIAGLDGRVILVELRDHLLSPYPPRSARSRPPSARGPGRRGRPGAARDRRRRRLSCSLSDGRVIPTRTLVWAAGVAASPLAEMLGVPLRASGRVPVQPYPAGHRSRRHLRRGRHGLPGGRARPAVPHADPRRQAAGDAGRAEHPAAAGRATAAPLHLLAGCATAASWPPSGAAGPSPGFSTGCRSAASVAWLAWLVLHLITLLGFRNRLNVFVNWVWNYLTYDRSVRLILELQPRPLPPSASASPEADPSSTHAGAWQPAEGLAGHGDDAPPGRARQPQPWLRHHARVQARADQDQPAAHQQQDTEIQQQPAGAALPDHQGPQQIHLVR